MSHVILKGNRRNPVKWHRFCWRNMPRKIRRKLRKQFGKADAIMMAHDYVNDHSEIFNNWTGF